MSGLDYEEYLASVGRKFRSSSGTTYSAHVDFDSKNQVMFGLDVAAERGVAMSCSPEIGMLFRRLLRL